MRQSEFKLRYDPNLDQYVMKHVHDETIYGGGLSDVVKSIGKRILGRTGKELIKSAAKKAATNAAKATGEYAGKKAGDKIVELLSKNKITVTSVTTSSPSVLMEPTVSASEPKKLTPDEINERVNQILSGGTLRRRKFI